MAIDKGIGTIIGLGLLAYAGMQLLKKREAVAGEVKEPGPLIERPWIDPFLPYTKEPEPIDTTLKDVMPLDPFAPPGPTPPMVQPSVAWTTMPATYSPSIVKPGIAFSMMANIVHVGPARQIHVIAIIAPPDPSRASGHPDPRTIRPQYWNWAIVNLPEAIVQTSTAFRVSWSYFPELPVGTYDVLRVIADPARKSGESNEQVLMRAVAMAWDNGVFHVVPAAQLSAYTPGTPYG